MKKHTAPTVNKFELVRLYRQALVHGVPLATVEEEVTAHVERLSVSSSVEREEDTRKETALKRQLPVALRFGALILPVAFITFGCYLVASAVLPIVKASIWQSQDVRTAELLSPIPVEEVMEVTPLVVQVKAQDDETAKKPKMIAVEFDYTNLSNWFEPSVAEQLKIQEKKTQGAQQFRLDIPKLNLENAVVQIGGTDLNKSLIAYPGTAAPGEFGAPVVFGHSVLRQFYNPNEKNPRRYTSIFSTIMTLKKGDEIFITYEGVKYTYVVQEKTEVKPTDVYILSQQFDAKRLKLVTCTPEGTYLRRGVVTAELIKQE